MTCTYDAAGGRPARTDDRLGYVPNMTYDTGPGEPADEPLVIDAHEPERGEGPAG